MPTGVFIRTSEYRVRMSMAMKASQTRYCIPKGNIPWNRGLTKENKSMARIAKGRKLYLDTHPEAREKLISQLRDNNFMNIATPEQKASMLEKRVARIRETRGLPEAVEKQRQGMILAYKNNPELREKSSRIMCRLHTDAKMHKHLVSSLKQGLHASWADPVKRENRIKNMLQGAMKRPTCLEQKVIEVINLYNLPYKYTGNGAFIIDSKNPDFVNTNGQKRLIEVYGEYWHSRNSSEAKDRTEAFASYGFQTLILWESDINSMSNEQIALAIRLFCQKSTA